MKVKNFFKNILANIIANFAVSAIVFIVGLSVSIWTGCKLIIGILAFSALCFFIATTKYKVRFNWSHKYKSSIHVVAIYPDQRMELFERISPVKSNGNFKGKITSVFDYDDVKIQSLSFESQKQAVMKCTVKDEFGNEKEFKDNYISFTNEPVVSAKYEVEFPFDKFSDISFSSQLIYGKETAPEFYVDVERPIKYLTIEVKVYNDVQINNVMQKRIPLFGEYNSSAKYIQGKSMESKDDFGCKVYTFRIKNPLLFHRYIICWDWI